MSVSVAIYDALHWNSGRGLWRYRNQLAMHIERCAFLRRHRETGSWPIGRAWLQVLASEVIEPITRLSRPPSIGIFPYNVLPALCPSGFGTRVLIVCDLIFLEGRFGRSVGSLYRRLKIQRSIRMADFVICISHTTRESILARWPRVDPWIIPCAIDNRFLTPVGRAKRQIGVFRILHFGGEIRSKGTALLLQAVGRVAKNGRSVELVIASMSKNPEFVRRYAEELGLDSSCYTILPRLSDSELLDVYSACDLHCMPSLAEGFGLPVIEAASRGLPNLLSPLPVFRELLGDSAIYFEDWTAESLSAGIEFAIENSLDEMADAARVRASAYSFDRIHRDFAIPVLTKLVEARER